MGAWLAGLALATLAPFPALPTAAFSADAAARQQAEWVERLRAAQDRLHTSRRQLAEAEQALREQRQKRYPRGEEKAHLLDRFEKARTELAEAERQWPEIVEAARRAGVSPGVLRGYAADSDPEPGS